MTKIKTCGLFRPADIDVANEAKPDYVGFVFAAKSPRFVTVDQAQALRQQLDRHIPAVGVYVSPTFATVQQAYQAGIIQLAQLHGALEPDLISRLQAAGIPAIRALTAQVAPVTTTADYLMLDGAKPGSGQSFDWHMIPRPTQPFFLAGGITPNNVTEAIKILHPAVIDVSSGIETNHLKDRQKMLAIVRSVHHAN